MPSFSVSVTNQASYSANICMFQVFSEISDPSAVTYVWLSAPSTPHSGVMQISWEPQYYFLWRTSQNNASDSGVFFSHTQSIEASLDHLNGITLSKVTGGSYQFSHPYGAYSGDKYFINSDKTVDPADHAYIGLSVNGAPVIAVEAHPNTLTSFQPQPHIYMMYGYLTAGQIMDPAMHIDRSLKLNFNSARHLDVTITPANKLYTTGSSNK